MPRRVHTALAYAAARQRANDSACAAVCVWVKYLSSAARAQGGVGDVWQGWWSGAKGVRVQLQQKITMLAGERLRQCREAWQVAGWNGDRRRC